MSKVEGTTSPSRQQDGDGSADTLQNTASVVVEKAVNQHQFGPLYVVNVMGISHYERQCVKCGIKQAYGHVYGSRKHPGYAKVDQTCHGA